MRLIVCTYTTRLRLVRDSEPVYPGLMHQIVTIIGPTLFAVVLGYLFGRVSRASEATLVNVSLYVATPCLVFSSMYSSKVVISGAAKMWASYLIILIGTFLIAWLVFGLVWKKHSALYLPIVFQNTINIPLPIITLAFGPEGVAQAMIFYIPYALLLNTLGVCMASGRKGLKEGLFVILRTPLIYAVVLALALNFSGAVLPEVVNKSFSLVGAASVPLMLLVLGMTMRGIRFTQIAATLTASVIRMGGGFCLGLLAVWALGLTGIPRAIVLFEAAMPSAMFASVLASRYENETELVSSVVLATTLMSVVAIPALLYYLT
jgi:predicted permease